MSECRMDETPHFLVSGEERHNEMIVRTTYFRVRLFSCLQQQLHLCQTKSEHFGSAQCDSGLTQDLNNVLIMFLRK